MASFPVGAISLHVEESGSGSPVVALHGLGSSAREWDLVAPRLAARHHMIVPDLRGHGQSERPRGRYRVSRFALDVSALCDRVSPDGAHMMGLSMGGMVAFELAVTRPDLVRSLIVVNSGPDMVPRTPQVASALARRLVLSHVLGPRGMARLLAPRLFPRPDQAELRERFRQAIAANDPGAYRRATRGLMGWSVLDRLHEIDCPVLVIGSERDYTPVSFKAAYTRRMRNARLVELSGSGHAANLDQPARLAEVVSAFLAEVDAAQESEAQPRTAPGAGSLAQGDEHAGSLTSP
jgi:3-oxoadipate enol-lactonase